MYRGGHLAGQHPLRLAPAGLRRVLGHRGGDPVEREEGEQLEVALDVAVVGIEPELVEVVGAGALGVEPDVAGLALAELGARGGRDERKDQAVHLPALALAHQLSARGDVAPLVAAAHLQLAALGLWNRCQKSYAWISM